MHRCIYHAECNRILANALLCVLHRETARNRLEATLRHYWNRGVYPGYGVIHHGRGYADDTSSGFLDQHLLNRKLSDVDEAFEVGGSESSEVLGRIVCEGLDEEYAGVVDERIDRPDLLIARSTIFAAVAAAPISPSTSASFSDGAKVPDFSMFREFATTK
jgi:hypothetical protein